MSKAQEDGILAPGREKEVAGDGMIKLQNPVADHFKTFIVGNICYYQERYEENPPVVELGSAKGQHVVICGAGPSLKEEADEWCREDVADEVWGCNSAAIWLHEQGHHVTHGFSVDQTPHMVTEWEATPPLEYLIASSVHPHLVEMLCDAERPVRFFHNYVGIKERPVEYCDCGHDQADHDAKGCAACDCDEYEGRTMAFEDWLYHSLYPPTMRAGSGLNSVTRAIDVARAMEFGQITILGADCSIRASKPPPEAPPGSPANMKWLREHTEMHADGGNAVRSDATPVTLNAEIDGRLWITKPDMAVSAMCLVQMKKAYGDELNLVGDTFPNAIKDKPQEFLDRLPNFVDHEGNVMGLV